MKPFLQYLRSRRPSVYLMIIIGVFVAWFGTSNWLRQTNLVTAQFDMGNMDQVLWNSLHGNFFQLTDPGAPTHILRTAIHADYLLLSYLPFYALWPDPRTMLVLQVLAVVSGAIPLFWIGRKLLDDRVAVFIAALYLLFPTLHWATMFDVHAVVLATPLILWAWWAMSEKRWWLYGVLAFATMLSKEEVGIAIAAIGLYWVWRRSHRWVAIGSIVIGLAWTALMLGWAIPSARGSSEHFALEYYQAYGNSYEEVIKTVITHPWRVISDLFSEQRHWAFKFLLIPVGGIAVFGLPILILALPELLINLLSNNVNQYAIFFQYYSVITPFVLLATIDGWRRARIWIRRYRPTWPHERLERYAIGGVIAAVLISLYAWSPIPGSRFHGDAIRPFITSPYRADVAKTKPLLKVSDRIVATNNVVPQFSQREYIWGFPNAVNDADVAIILTGGLYEFVANEQIAARVEELRQDPNWTLLYHREQYWVFRHTPRDQ